MSRHAGPAREDDVLTVCDSYVGRHRKEES